jgi:hypothetical protein
VAELLCVSPVKQSSLLPTYAEHSLLRQLFIHRDVAPHKTNRRRDCQEFFEYLDERITPAPAKRRAGLATTLPAIEALLAACGSPSVQAAFTTTSPNCSAKA